MPRIEQKLMTEWEFTLGEPIDENFKKVVLPHDWAISAPFNKDMDQGEQQGFRERWGIGWYRREVKVEKKNGYSYYLDFGGIYENSTIWLNGCEAGGHKYGYSSFKLDVTKIIKDGVNQILIRVDNTQSPVDRWYSGCGIYRTVKLVEVEKQHLEAWDIVVHTRVEGEAAKVSIDTGSTYNVRASLTLCYNCYVDKLEESIIDEENICIQNMSDEKGKIELFVPNAKLWSAKTPNLYNLKLELLDCDRVSDELLLRIGIRDIQMIPKRGMFVNGKSVALNGVCLHQEVGCRGIAGKKEHWRARLLELKEMGCNAIRAAHHTFASEFLDLCDEIGFYVYEECFDKWTGGLYGRYFENCWKQDVEAMVKRDRNRTCIFIWGVGNEVENQAQDSMLSILKMLKEYVLKFDNTRPISYAMNPHFKREANIDMSKIKDIQQFVDEEDDFEIYDPIERVERIKRIADIVDVISCNYQEQWYELIHEQIPDKLILGTEVYQFFKGDYNQMQNFTDENPVLFAKKYDYCIGSMIWTGYDYLGESMGYPAKGWSGALLRTNGERRASYYIMQSYWQEKPMVHFSVMDYSLTDEGVKEHWDMPMYAEHWHFPQFHKTVIPYMIASNCDEVSLYLNDKRFYVPKPVECKNNIITGFLPYLPGSVKVLGYRDGKEVCSYSIATPKAPVKLKFDKSLTVLAEENYEIMLTVRAVDEEERPYFRESAHVRFRVNEAAQIVAVDNGNIMGNEPYEEDNIHMYHGCASVMLRLNGDAGSVIVWADCEGMQSAKEVIMVN